VSRLIFCLTRLLAGVGVLLVVGVAPAVAEYSVTYKPEGLHETELIADNFDGNVEERIEYTEPPGDYLEGTSEGGGSNGDGTYEYDEVCEKYYEHGGCEEWVTIVKQNSEAELPPGFKKLEHLEIESDYGGAHAVTFYRYGWKPAPKNRTGSEDVTKENRNVRAVRMGNR
jgi:hypothetical protein